VRQAYKVRRAYEAKLEYKAKQASLVLPVLTALRGSLVLPEYKDKPEYKDRLVWPGPQASMASLVYKA
jgi:hypothetical protein